MAAYTETRILEGLLSHLSSMPGQTLPVAWPGLDFEPPADQKYLRVTYLPNVTTSFLLGENEPKEHIGQLQIDVMWPQGAGTSQPTEIAGAIIQRFKDGTTIENEGVRIDVSSQPDPGPYLESPPNLQLPVTINYQSFNA